MNRRHVRLGRSVALLLAVVLPGTDARADLDRQDREMERLLREGEVIEIREIETGTTFPKRLTLELDGDVHDAAFKFAQFERPDTRRPGTAAAAQLFLDSYRHEVAAYRLDRLLGMNMVPVAVIRKIDGTEGALIEWISDALDERAQRGTIWPRDPTRLLHQEMVMNLFDALILNLNRDGANQLITPDDWKLHLIDHSRGFREGEELPGSFTAKPASLPRSLLEGLEGLDIATLEERLEGLISHPQIEAILLRRDKILDKIATDRKRYGDAKVFQD